MCWTPIREPVWCRAFPGRSPGRNTWSISARDVWRRSCTANPSTGAIVFSCRRGGILLAEIQQAADVTYRIYDFERRDAQGRLRELHVEKALEAMDFSASGDPKVRYTLREDALTPLAECPYFSTGLLHGRRPLLRETAGEFVIHTCVGGRGRLRDVQGRVVELHPGVCVLTPACLERVEIVPEEVGVELLETRPA